jgi:SAM-dependent methyltransferase
MTDDRNVWDMAYRRRGRLWGGGTPPLTDIPISGRILELGCGNGKILSSLSQEGVSVVGVDFSRSALTSILPGHTTGPYHLVLADARFLPFFPSSFDLVIARHIVGHMSQAGREEIAGEILRILRPGGVLDFSGFSRDDFRFGQGTVTEEASFCRGTGISTHYFTREETLSLFSGFACRTLKNYHWTLRIRGTEYVRAEIQAVFTRSLQ